MVRRSMPRIRVRVHERGDPRLDGILRLIEEAARPRPLPDVLGAMCAAIAELAPADVVSVYTRNGDTLVMAANVGFPEHAVGNVRLKVGEGITGFAAECLRPVSVDVASDEEHYKHVPGIGEEKFPVFLAVPLLVAGTASGVLVLQRRGKESFGADEVALAAALSAPVHYAIERAATRRLDATREITTATRTARLAGTGVSEGVALGRAEVLPSLDGASVPCAPDAAARAFRDVGAALEKACRKVGEELGRDAPRLRGLCTVLEDERLGGLVKKECAKQGVPAGLRSVARDYARTPFRVDDWLGEGGSELAERAAEVEDLCVLLAARLAGARTPSAGAVLMLHRLSAFAAAIAVSSKVSAIVLGDPVDDDSLGARVARAAGLPVVSEVAGLFAWVRAGDRLLVEGGMGLVRVNPSASDVARFRARAKKTDKP
jgi:phosphotransferase system enzyme I (PtsP)